MRHTSEMVLTVQTEDHKQISLSRDQWGDHIGYATGSQTAIVINNWIELPKKIIERFSVQPGDFTAIET
jgi:hypothetical protein